ncbi:MAG: hypothetical protein ACXVCM_18715, partial [Ktedonobacteraceae bacterium]
LKRRQVQAYVSSLKEKRYHDSETEYESQPYLQIRERYATSHSHGIPTFASDFLQTADCLTMAHEPCTRQSYEQQPITRRRIYTFSVMRGSLCSLNNRNVMIAAFKTGMKQ